MKTREGVFLALGIWTALMVCVFLMLRRDHARHLQSEAIAQARARLETLEISQRWIAGQGGVYIPEGPDLPPNPCRHTDTEPLTLPDGRRLVHVSPVYFTRLLADVSADLGGAVVRLTGLDPMNAENAPRAWERRALQALRAGEFRFTEINGAEGRGQEFRYMEPFRVREECAACHQIEPGKPQELKGGLSVTLPVEPFLSGVNSGMKLPAALCFLAWICGSGLLLTEGRRVRTIASLVGHLQVMASSDSLTGVLNRRGFFERARELLLSTSIDGGRNCQAILLYLDLDDMKGINDRLGHDAGDRALQHVAARLRQRFDGSAIIGRLGGDEFAVLSMAATSTDPSALGEAVCGSIASAPLEEADGYCPTVSLGFATCPGWPCPPVDELLRTADRMMYLQKQHKGRHHIRQQSRRGQI